MRQARNYAPSQTVRSTTKLPAIQRLASADRDAAIKHLQHEMAFSLTPAPKRQAEVVELGTQQTPRQKQLSFDFSSIIGRRMTQEDAELVHCGQRYQITAVFDGHGGETCSQFCAKNFVDIFYKEVENNTLRNALHATCMRLDAMFCRLNQPTVGCTLTCCVLDSVMKQFVVANVGDSKTLISFPNKLFSTADHKPSAKEEQMRIKRAFPNTRIITIMGVARLDGQLSLSRAIGDEYMKQSGIIPEPDLTEMGSSEVDYVLLACDGLFDVFNVGEVDDMIRTMRSNKRVQKYATRQILLDIALNYFKGNLAEGDKLMQQVSGQRVYRTEACEEVNIAASASKRASQILTKMAFWKNSMDNVTVIVGFPE